MASPTLFSLSPDRQSTGFPTWMASNHYQDSDPENGKLIKRSYNTFTSKPNPFIKQCEESGSQTYSFKRMKKSPDDKGPDSEPPLNESTSISPRTILRPENMFGEEHERTANFPHDREVPDFNQRMSNIVKEETDRLSNLEESGDLDRDEKTLLCYTCSKTVKESQFSLHLFFGEIKCKKCCRKVYSCGHFRESIIDDMANLEACQHTYKYRINSAEYLSSKLTDDILNSSDPYQKLKDGMASYISALKVLEKEDPWKRAIRQCTKYLKKSIFRECQSSVNLAQTSDTSFSDPSQENPVSEADAGEFQMSQAYSLDHLENVVEYEVANDPSEWRVSECTADADSRTNRSDEHSTNTYRDVHNVEPSVSNIGHSLANKDRNSESSTASKHNIKASTSQDFLQTPENGYYLVIRHAIEECPMCYTELCATMFTVNVETFLLTTVCSGCDLTIYIVFTPPDGSAPRISIVTEEKSSEEEHQKAKKEVKAGKDKIRIRDFFKR